jgi:aspartokinase
MNPLRSPATVLKFGGAALADGAGVERAASVLGERGGERPVVVVSALQGVTRALDRLGRDAAEGRAVDLAEIRVRHRTLARQLALDPELLDRYLAELATLLRGVQHRRRPQRRRATRSWRSASA